MVAGAVMPDLLPGDALRSAPCSDCGAVVVVKVRGVYGDTADCDLELVGSDRPCSRCFETCAQLAADFGVRT